jgi:hypothetical protein
MTRLFSTLIIMAFTASVIAGELSTPAPPGATLYFITPTDGQTVENPFTVRFGLGGMGVAPAGVERENTGHHHLLIDTDIDTLDLTRPLPATDAVKHFGGGQTETVLELPPGRHTLQLLLGNHIHVPHVPPVLSDKITVTVK